MAIFATAVAAPPAAAAIQKALTGLGNRDGHICDEILEPAIGAEIYVYLVLSDCYRPPREMEKKKKHTLSIVHGLFFALPLPFICISLLCRSSQPP